MEEREDVIELEVQSDFYTAKRCLTMPEFLL